MDKMSALKVKINVFKELIKTEKSASKMWKDNISLPRKQALAITSTKVSKKHLAMDISHQDIKYTIFTTIQTYKARCFKYTALYNEYLLMGMEYISLQDEYLALADCTTGE